MGACRRRRLLLVGCLWAWLPARAGAAYYEEVLYGAEVHRVVANVGETTPVGATRRQFDPGFYGSVEDLFPIAPNLSFGTLVGYHRFADRRITSQAPALVYTNQMQILSLAGVLRLRLTPPEFLFEPYLAAGFSGNRLYLLQKGTLLGQGFTARPAFWRNGFLGQVGFEYRHDALLIGLEGSFQTFGRYLNAVTGSFHVGLRFAR